MDVSNLVRPRVSRVQVHDEPLTPRKGLSTKENDDRNLTEKMNALQNKIARLERMTPKRSATPKTTRGAETFGHEAQAVLFEKQE